MAERRRRLRRKLIMTNRIRIVTSALVLLAAMSSGAHAGVLVSPPMTPGDGNWLECQITNVGGSPATVTIEIFGEYPTPVDDGVLLASGSPTLAPSTTDGVATVEGSGPTHNPHVCKFTVPGSKGPNFRASACTTYGGVPIACVPAE